MYIHGSFYNKQDEKVTVLIVTKDCLLYTSDAADERSGV